MVKRANQNRAELVEVLARAIPALQDANDAFDEVAGLVLGVNRTDLRLLGAIVRDGLSAPSAIADATGLSRPAVTIALNRLERAGLIRRASDPGNRRSVRIEPTPEAVRQCEQIWGPLAAEGMTLFEAYSTDELDAMARILEAARVIQERHAERVRGLAKKKKPR
jgi:DNA-binding MarR family transcriptional regulator